MAHDARQVTIIGHERPSRFRRSRVRCAAARRIPFGAAAGAGGRLGLAAVRRSLPGRRGLVAGLRHRRARRCDVDSRLATAHPSGRSRRIRRRGGFLPARRRPFRVRIPVVSDRTSLVVGAASRTGRAARTRWHAPRASPACCSTSTAARARKSRAATASRGSRRRCGARAPHSGNGTCRATRAPRVPCGWR